MYRIWLLLSAATVAVVLALAGCDHPAAGAEPSPHPNLPPRPGPYTTAAR